MTTSKSPSPLPYRLSEGLGAIKAPAKAAGAFKRASKPFRVGQTRMKSWRGLYGTQASDPMWFKRCSDYWALQMGTYGVKFNDFQIKVLADPARQAGAPDTAIITTWATVAEILPGQRVEHG